ncbi:uncharacterized protein LOC132734692, partial [Ruditapes philippinarum]|uniref:uncharacterized protein LOC132734692 n=1 Tax=Ruditapes philippinarum TaxID=129788 RepID=UPI00295A8A1C
MDSEQFEHTHTFCGLHPYTAYSFSVRIRPTGVYSGYYSEPVIHKSTTYSDIPSASPDVTDYRWDQRECEDGGQKRLVCLFWKPIKAENQNGPMKGLHGEFTALPPANHIIKEDWTAEVTYGCSFILCNTSYLFTIKARNINGTSKRGPAITIPAFVPGSIIDVDHELNVGHATPNNV